MTDHNKNQNTYTHTIKDFITNYSKTIMEEVKVKKFDQCIDRFRWIIHQEMESQVKNDHSDSITKLAFKMSTEPKKVEISSEEIDNVQENFKGNYYLYCQDLTMNYVRQNFKNEILDFEICSEECKLKYSGTVWDIFLRNRCHRKCEDTYNSTVKISLDQKLTAQEKNDLFK